MKQNQFYKIKEEIAWRKKEGEIAVIVSPLTETIYTLNKTATMVWEMLESPNSLENITQYLYEIFKENNNLKIEDLKEDVAEIIEDFKQRNLLDKMVDNK